MLGKERSLLGSVIIDLVETRRGAIAV